MNPSVAYDERDKEVLLEMDRRGIEVVTVDRLQDIYEKVTDVKRRHTKRRRIRALTSTDDFEEISFGRWRWVGEPPTEDR